MASGFIFAIALFSQCITAGGSNDHMLNSKLNILNDLCPYSTFCNHYSPERNQTEWSDSKPCCASCSCRPDCGLSNSCCFEEYDTYRMADNMDCIIPLVKHPEGMRVVDEVEKYYMITKCYVNERIENTCRHRNGTDFLSPVSSSDTGLIYYNEDCAQCNGVQSESRIPWKLIIVTATRSKTLSWSWQLESVLDTRSWYSIYVPRNDKYIRYWQCDHDEVPCKLEDSDMITLCDKLNMPFELNEDNYNPTVYRNIFCALCDGKKEETIKSSSICLTEKSVFKSKGYTVINVLDFKNIKHFTDLIQLVAVAASRPADEAFCQGNEVFNTFTNSCLSLLCPEGTYNDGQVCRSVGVSVQGLNRRMLQLELLVGSTEYFTTSLFESLTEEQQANPYLWLSSSCPPNHMKSGIDVFISPPISNVSKQVQSIVVRLQVEFTDMLLGEVARELKSACFDAGIWTINLAGRTSRIQSRLYKYASHIEDGLETPRVVIAFHGYPKVSSQLYERVAGDDLITQVATESVSKLWFCRQVQLESGEVQYEFSSIYIRPTMFEISDSKFSFFYDRLTFQHPVFRICVDDFYKARDIKVETSGFCEFNNIVIISGLVQTVKIWAFLYMCVFLLIHI